MVVSLASCLLGVAHPPPPPLSPLKFNTYVVSLIGGSCRAASLGEEGVLQDNNIEASE